MTLDDETPTEGKLVGETLSTLFVGISKIGSAVGVAGKVMIGRPKESTLDGGVGIMSRLGSGMENGGGPVIAGNPVEGKPSDGRPDAGVVKEGSPIVGKLADGKPIGFGLAEGAFPEGDIWPTGRAVVNVAEGRAMITSVLGGKLAEGRLPDERLSDGRPTGLTEGRPGEIGLTEGVLGVLRETKGRPIGLAEIREASRKGRMEGRCMTFAAEGGFPFLSLFSESLS